MRSVSWVPWVGMQSVIVAFSSHTDFLKHLIAIQTVSSAVGGKMLYILHYISVYTEPQIQTLCASEISYYFKGTFRMQIVCQHLFVSKLRW